MRRHYARGHRHGCRDFQIVPDIILSHFAKRYAYRVHTAEESVHVKPLPGSLCGWLAFAFCATQASAGDIAFRENFETHIYYGWPVPYAGSTTVSAGTVLAYKVTIPSVTSLDRIGLYAAAGTSGYTLAVYTDAGGKPAALESSTMPASINTGFNQSYVPYVTLPVGVHWIALRLQANSTNVGYDATQTDTLCVRNSLISNIDDPWPSSFGASVCSTDGLMNLYLITFNP
jgi:hypothetical protein